MYRNKVSLYKTSLIFMRIIQDKNRDLNKELLGMTGKFHTYCGDFHSLKNKAALEFECFQMLSMNAGKVIGSYHSCLDIEKGEESIYLLY